MKGNKKAIIVIVLLVLLGITTGYVSSAYAKYASEISDNQGTVTVAKWAFTTDNAVQTLTINLADTYHASTLGSGRIAPGTAGSFNVAVKNGTSETGVDFTVKLNSISGTTIPANLKFYKDSGYTTELTPGTSTITGQLTAGDSTGVSVPIYWRWEFGSSNDVSDSVNVADTTAGTAGSSLTIGVDITGVQTQPSATAITSHIN